MDGQRSVSNVVNDTADSCEEPDQKEANDGNRQREEDRDRV